MNILTQVSVRLDSDAFVVFITQAGFSIFHAGRFGKPSIPFYLRTLKNSQNKYGKTRTIVKINEL